MKRTLAVALCALAPSAAQACNADLFTVEDWAVEESQREDFPPGKEVSASFRYVGSKPTRMVEAFVRFDDALGKHIGELRIARDHHFQPGEHGTAETFYRDPAFARAPDLHPDDVIVTTCTRAVIYEDGTKEEF